MCLDCCRPPKGQQSAFLRAASLPLANWRLGLLLLLLLLLLPVLLLLLLEGAVPVHADLLLRRCQQRHFRRCLLMCVGALSPCNKSQLTALERHYVISFVHGPWPHSMSRSRRRERSRKGQQQHRRVW